MATMPASSIQSAAPTRDGRRTTAEVSLQLVTFQLLNEEFAMPTLEVREIIRMTATTPVPHAPAFVEGVINLRGQIIPVVDLRKRFNLPAKDKTEATRIIVVEVGEHVLGLIVDGVSEVLRLPADTVSPPPPVIANGIGAEYIKGIAHHGGRMIILIEMRKVFTLKEMAKLEAM